jgi:hypothetical protein
MSPQKKFVAWASVVVAPGAVAIWHFAERLHTLQWVIHWHENKSVQAAWQFLSSSSGQTVLLLLLLTAALMILRELRRRLTSASQKVPTQSPIVIMRRTVQRVTHEKTLILRETETREEIDEPLETTAPSHLSPDNDSSVHS